MNQVYSTRLARRGRIFPEIVLSPEEKAKKQAEIQAFRQRCRPIFERLRPQLIENYYNWFIVIEPDTEEYFIDRDRMAALLKALDKHPEALFYTFRLNETGVCGRV
ncbi:MAG TPA: hypothetical protein DDZ80_18070 [Cyanobacteria bacterium UBA8803]|nr:hypothetical protein [Cyanobacteria bacterium UBA9273]HBL60293.1 hypothetical protein [Cyanobacteria bacterium UBA8803]